jgi:hypothetical protein
VSGSSTSITPALRSGINSSCYFSTTSKMKRGGMSCPSFLHYIKQVQPYCAALALACAKFGSPLSCFSALTQSSTSYPGAQPRWCTARILGERYLLWMVRCVRSWRLLGCRYGPRTSAPPRVNCVELFAVCCDADRWRMLARHDLRMT